jgi:CheY-like chemotaxis protein
VRTDKLIILLVEDSEEDVILIRHAFEACGCSGTVAHVPDGVAAIDYLVGTPPYDDRDRFPFPNTLLIDLKMPRLDGFELLQWLQEHPRCAVIPSIIYSSSYLEPDVARAYQLNANAFIAKPNNLSGIINVIKAIRQFWSLCERPPVPETANCSP